MYVFNIAHSNNDSNCIPLFFMYLQPKAFWHCQTVVLYRSTISLRENQLKLKVTTETLKLKPVFNKLHLMCSNYHTTVWIMCKKSLVTCEVWIRLCAIFSLWTWLWITSSGKFPINKDIILLSKYTHIPTPHFQIWTDLNCDTFLSNYVAAELANLGEQRHVHSSDSLLSISLFCRGGTLKWLAGSPTNC